MRTKLPFMLRVAPFVLFTGIFFLMAVGKTVSLSFGYDPLLGHHQFTWRYYQAIFANKTFMRTLLRTFSVTFSSSLLASLIGLRLAFLVKRSHSWGAKFLSKMANVPLVLPHIFMVLVFMWCFDQTGLLVRLVHLLGWQQFTLPVLIGDPYQLGILLTYLWKETPYVLLTLFLVVRQLDDDYFLAAQNLGANRWQRLWYVEWPLVQPAFFNALIIVFSFSFGAYEVPALLGSQKYELLPVMIYELYQQSDLTLRPLIMSFNVVISVIAIGCASLLLLLSWWLPGGRRRQRV